MILRSSISNSSAEFRRITNIQNIMRKWPKNLNMQSHPVDFAACTHGRLTFFFKSLKKLRRIIYFRRS